MDAERKIRALLDAPNELIKLAEPAAEIFGDVVRERKLLLSVIRVGYPNEMSDAEVWERSRHQRKMIEIVKADECGCDVCKSFLCLEADEPCLKWEE